MDQTLAKLMWLRVDKSRHAHDLFNLRITRHFIAVGSTRQAFVAVCMGANKSLPTGAILLRQLSRYLRAVVDFRPRNKVNMLG
jgi:hypothetical protein